MVGLHKLLGEGEILPDKHEEVFVGTFKCGDLRHYRTHYKAAKFRCQGLFSRLETGWRKRGDSNSHALSVRVISNHLGHQLPNASVRWRKRGEFNPRCRFSTDTSAFKAGDFSNSSTLPLNGGG